LLGGSRALDGGEDIGWCVFLDVAEDGTCGGVNALQVSGGRLDGVSVGCCSQIKVEEEEEEEIEYKMYLVGRP
jgi:hypothetical protein